MNGMKDHAFAATEMTDGSATVLLLLALPPRVRGLGLRFLYYGWMQDTCNMVTAVCWQGSGTGYKGALSTIDRPELLARQEHRHD